MTQKPIVQVCEFYVEGMHCAACEMLIESNLSEHTKVKYVKASLSSQKVLVTLDADTVLENIHSELNNLIKDSGYILHTALSNKSKINFRELGTAFLMSMVFVAAFIVLQKLGVVNLLNSNEITLPFVFLIGVVASLSTCMAIVGGLVLSLSSTYAKADSKNSAVPLVKFHVARILSFFILGGLIGLLGSAFTLTTQTSFILNVGLFLVMVILGINLLDIFPFAKRLQVHLPKVFSKSFLNREQSSDFITPVFLGAATFFLPCGFTQSMQVYSLTTGSFISGAVTMLVFALGTFPMLALISFTSVKLAKGLRSKLFFKTAGFIILFFALFNFFGALTAAGLIGPVLNF